MNNFSFEPLKLKLATNNIIIPMENGVADLTNAETSAKIMLAGKELLPIFDESIGGRNLYKRYLDGYISNNQYRQIKVENGLLYWRQLDNSTSPLNIMLYDFDDFVQDYRFSFKTTAPSTLIRSNLFNAIFNTYPIAITDLGSYRYAVISFRQPQPLNGPTIGWYGNKPSDPIETFAYWDFKFERGTVATPWTPAPEEVLQNATLSSYNCSAAIVGDLIKITSHTPDTKRGWVDVTVNYGNLSNTKRLNWSVEGVEVYKPLGTLLTMNNRGIKL